MDVDWFGGWQNSASASAWQQQRASFRATSVTYCTALKLVSADREHVLVIWAIQNSPATLCLRRCSSIDKDVDYQHSCNARSRYRPMLHKDPAFTMTRHLTCRRGMWSIAPLLRGIDVGVPLSTISNMPLDCRWSWPGYDRRQPIDTSNKDAR